MVRPRCSGSLGCRHGYRPPVPLGDAARPGQARRVQCSAGHFHVRADRGGLSRPFGASSTHPLCALESPGNASDPAGRVRKRSRRMTNIEPAKLAQANRSKPLLSIIIPTCNRQVYAASAIRCALAIPSDDIEIVVQDCSDDDLLSSLIAPERLDKRLSYRYERPAHMTENWNRAIGRATGEYVCIIGDDDGVIPEIVQA